MVFCGPSHTRLRHPPPWIGLCGREQRNGIGCFFWICWKRVSSVTVDCISSEWMYRRAAGNNLCARRVSGLTFSCAGLLISEERDEMQRGTFLCGFEIGSFLL